MAPALSLDRPELDQDPRTWRSDPELIAAFEAHERAQGTQRLVVGCFLTMVLLPMGLIVDFFMNWPSGVSLWALGGVRVGGALLIVPLLLLFRTEVGIRHHQTLGMLLAVIPGAVMCVLIRLGEKPWPYYAGINLVLLAMATVAQWTWRQSLCACLLLLGMYLAATAQQIPAAPGMYFNNLWFLVLTGIIMVVGSELQSRLRFRDFAANEALRRSRRALELSYERLKELDELKGRFFANVSHELRTPLTLMLAPLESLLRHTAQEDVRRRQPLETMRDNSMRLLRLINDLLDLVRLDARRLRLDCSTIEVPTFLRGLVLAVQSLAEERGLELLCEVDPALTTLEADPDKLEKVFLNLLFNAIKFTAAGGKIRLSARCEDEQARFDVTDNGMGVAAEDLPYLFSRFWQADFLEPPQGPGRRDRARSGQGVGHRARRLGQRREHPGPGHDHDGPASATGGGARHGAGRRGRRRAGPQHGSTFRAGKRGGQGVVERPVPTRRAVRQREPVAAIGASPADIGPRRPAAGAGRGRRTGHVAVPADDPGDGLRGDRGGGW